MNDNPVELARSPTLSLCFTAGLVITVLGYVYNTCAAVARSTMLATLQQMADEA